MEAGNVTLNLLLALLIFTTFVKTATVLSICRYGLGLLGFEFGAVCLVVSLALSIFMCPPELTAVGFPDVIFSRTQNVEVASVADALTPYMERRVDPSIRRYLGHQGAGEAKNLDQEEPKRVGGLRELVPLYVLSELKAAFQVGCLLLVPFVVIDLVSAHLLALLGVQQLAAQAVSLPLKILVFMASGGWGLLGKKILGFE
jgi:flagellar biosynthesis protein FliP